MSRIDIEDDTIEWECVHCGADHTMPRGDYGVWDVPELTCSTCGKVTEAELDGDTDHGFYRYGVAPYVPKEKP